jgi:hypothetical protein
MLEKNSPSMQDGFNGAADASILAFWADKTLITISTGVMVQCTKKTRDLLKRAGFSRCRTHDFYPVRVCCDGFGRLQLGKPWRRR